METEWKLTEALLREGLDAVIKCLEGELRCCREPLPPQVTECLAAEVDFGYMHLTYGAGADDQRELLDRLRSLREDLGERFAELSAPELARAVIEIDPIAARFPMEAGWKGARDRIGLLAEPLGDLPILVPVRGAERRSAERRIAWHLRQMGVPAGSRSESPSGAARKESGMSGMSCGLEVTWESLQDDLLASLEAVEAALALQAPASALECLSAEAHLCSTCLSFPANPADMRKLLRRLRSMLDGRESLPALTAPSLARLIVDLDPVEASFSSCAPWSGVMDRVTKSDEFRFIGEAPVRVAVRGAGRADAERRIAWLLRQMGVPAGSRSESPSGAAERRAA
ncbi:MAG: hypothetical protein OXN97_12330 [Bryobacterales bacterium]|nr:hypothetical protein [Bryobacterales bacterium]